MATISGDPLVTSAGAAVRGRPRTGPRPHPVPRWSWLWLLVGAGVLPFASMQTLIPLAAWVAPVFLMRFTRSQRPAIGLPVLVVAMCLALLVGLRGGFLPTGNGIGYHLFVVTLGVGGAVPFAVDRVLAPWSSGLARTLVFPAAVTTVELVGAISSATAPRAARPTPSTPACRCCNWPR